MKNMIFESELKVLKILWAQGETTAKEMAIMLNATTGWSKATTYTIIRKCVDKGMIERIGYNFLCRPIVSEEEAQQLESEILVEKMFDGQPDRLIASLLGGERLTPDQVNTLRHTVQQFSAS